MPSISVRNLPEGVHRALKRRAASHGRSAEAEARAILAEAVLPRERVRIGSALRRIGEGHGVPESFEAPRDPTPVDPARYE